MDTWDHPSELELTREHGLVGLDGRVLRRARERGEKLRLARGVYVPSTVWQSADDDARYLLRIQAAVLTRVSSPVLSHFSAARMWGLPVLGSWPREVHFIVPSGVVRRSQNGIVWHRTPLSDDDVVEVDGLLVTSRLRTLVDLARVSPFVSAVVALDAGLRPLPTWVRTTGTDTVLKDELTEAALRLGAAPGGRPARMAADFADGLAASPGESASRANVFLAGMPAPVLQVEYRSADGHRDITDFTWEADRHVRRRVLLGEFDGKVKYTRNQYLKGRSIEEVVWEEKLREDRLRAPDRGMVRWIWNTALSPVRLRTLLLEAGLRPEKR
ncbi:type IV toxin-antitoxin system AbiEi family antitoxin domain-containing protein [Cryobacterium tepidiphilum]|uniref:Type IV toxin-antitoxin system AbiEi family antitoxin domain-containing protein n=1 Tax=Cryobacterium tepidiphilum TaxID=2486026 RepID=A0A3M8LR05_9MICO|nr:hypothetical protein [Cryobacterium tepidiphilum]RNE66938.1 hypothetical protein EEJ31_01635 [Cryobacterium tepidiphilum]